MKTIAVRKDILKNLLDCLMQDYGEQFDMTASDVGEAEAMMDGSSEAYFALSIIDRLVRGKKADHEIWKWELMRKSMKIGDVAKRYTFLEKALQKKGKK